MNGVQSLYGIAVLFGAVGVALRLAPAPSLVPEAQLPSGRIPVATVAGQAAPGNYGPIIASNVFSSSRTTPAARLVPEGFRRDTQTAANRRAKKPADLLPRLYGITRGAEGAVALVDADPAIPGAEVYRVGDQVRGGRIIAITDSTVVLGRPSGPLVLRLPAAKGDRR